MKFLKAVLGAIRDILIVYHLVPRFAHHLLCPYRRKRWFIKLRMRFTSKQNPVKIDELLKELNGLKHIAVFAMHPEDLDQTLIQFPPLKRLIRFFERHRLISWIPFQKMINWFFVHLVPAVTCSYMKWDLKDGRTILGIVMGFPVGAEDIYKNMVLARKRCLQLAYLAEAHGCTHYGMAGLIPWITHGGKTIMEESRNFACSCTGHALTVGSIEEIMYEILGLLRLDIGELCVAVVGALGNMGMPTSRLVASLKPKELLLVDLPRKDVALQRFKQELASQCEVTTSVDLKDLKVADLIIIVTNAKGSLVKPEHLKERVIIIDDTHPQNISPHELRRCPKPDAVLYIRVSLRARDLETNFSFPMVRGFVYTCLASVMVLAAEGYEGDYDLMGRFGVEEARNIVKWGRALGVGPSTLQGARRVITWLQVTKAKK